MLIKTSTTTVILFLLMPVFLFSQLFTGTVRGENYKIQAELLKKGTSSALEQLEKKNLVYIESRICGDTLIENIVRKDGSLYSRSIQFGSALYLKNTQEGYYFKFKAPPNFANKVPIQNWKKAKKRYQSLELDFSTKNPNSQVYTYFITLDTNRYQSQVELEGLFDSKFHPDGAKLKWAVSNDDYVFIRENKFISQSDLICKDLINDFWIKDKKEEAVHWTVYNNALKTTDQIIPQKDRINIPPAEFQNEFEEPVFLNEFRGKYVYIDFWASWCSPCRAEMPFTKKIRDKYQDKGLEVISITIDQAAAKPKWRAMIEKLEMEWHNWYLEYGKDSSLAKGIQLSGIPRYILLDPAGKIMNDNAPRPSDAGLIEFLDKVLKVQRD